MEETERPRMTVRDLTTNPPGKGSRHVAARYKIREAYADTYRKALADPARAGRFKVSVTGAGRPNAYIALVKVPSESEKVDFDVLFELDYGESKATSSAGVRLYCNSPSWIFTYGYVAAKSGMLIPGWEGQLGLAATEPPAVTNPAEDMGFDKIVFQAALFLTGRGGVVTVYDAARASSQGWVAPRPGDPRLSAQAKLAEYRRAEKARRVETRAAKAKENETRRKIEEEARRKIEEEAGEGERRAARRVSAAAQSKAIKPSKSRPAVKAVKAARRSKSAVSATRRAR